MTNTSSTQTKTPLHISFLFGILALFGLLNFASGWIMSDPSGFFPGVTRDGAGIITLLASNGARQLGIAVLLISAAFTRNRGMVQSGLIVRIICEVLDIVLYAFIVNQPASAGIAAILLVWEIVAAFQVFRKTN